MPARKTQKRLVRSRRLEITYRALRQVAEYLNCRLEPLTGLRRQIEALKNLDRQKGYRREEPFRYRFRCRQRIVEDATRSLGAQPHDAVVRQPAGGHLPLAARGRRLPHAHYKTVSRDLRHRKQAMSHPASSFDFQLFYLLSSHV